MMLPHSSTCMSCVSRNHSGQEQSHQLGLSATKDVIVTNDEMSINDNTVARFSLLLHGDLGECHRSSAH